MDLHSPFVCCVYDMYPPSMRLNGGFYSLKTADNRTEVVAYTVDRGTGFLVYKASPIFLNRYSDLIPIDGIDEWYLKNDLAVWLDSIYFLSFLHCSIEGMIHATNL